MLHLVVRLEKRKQRMIDQAGMVTQRLTNMSVAGETERDREAER